MTANRILFISLISIIVIVVMIASKQISIAPSSRTTETSNLRSVSMNIDKSTYNVDELVGINLAVVDQKSKPLCESGYELLIHPGDIRVPLDISSECGQTTGFTTHIGRHKTTLPGTYTASFHNASASFTVLDSHGNSPLSPAISISRYSPSQITQSNRYPMIITITALDNVTGTITDTVPEGFEFAWYGTATVNTTASRPSISWNVQLSKGETIDLKYEYLAGNTPETVTLGPLTLNQNDILHSSWQLLVTDKR
jgi:hypothetical protein